MRGRIGSARVARGLLLGGLALAAASGEALLAPAAAATKAGVSAAVHGTVERSKEAAPASPLKSGEDVFMGDTVRTAEQSGLQLLLLDQTVFTVGPSSELVVDEFVYDPANDALSLSAKLLRGGFRLVSGAIGKEKPENVDIELPSATVGIRGTLVSFLVTSDGIYVKLDGPGPDNTGIEKEGAVQITVAGKTIDLFRPGWVVKIALDGSDVSDPFRATDDLLRFFEDAVGRDVVTTIRSSDGIFTDPITDADIRSSDALEIVQILADTEGSDQGSEDLLPRDEGDMPPMEEQPEYEPPEYEPPPPPDNI